MRIGSLILALIALPTIALAQTARPQIETIPAQTRPGVAFQIRVSGEWPNTCPPELLPVVIVDRTIDLAVRQSDQICGQAITPFSVTFDPAAVAGARFPQSGVYRVRFSVKDEVNRPSLMGFRVIDVRAAGARSVQPEAGFWMPDEAGEFATSGSGVGFMLELQNNSLAVTTNAYAPGGPATWYLSAGALSGFTFRGELLQSVGGQPVWGEYRGPQWVAPVGALDIEFVSDSAAVAWYSRPSGEAASDPLELMPVSMRRMNFALLGEGQALAGTWVYTAPAARNEMAPALVQLSYRADRSSPGEAVLIDAQRGFELRCGVDLARKDGPPTSCLLLANGAERARFDNNSLSRLSGNSAGESVVLVRVSN